MVELSSVCNVFKSRFDQEYATDAACKGLV